MERHNRKKESLRRRIIESDSESEVDDVNELSMSMKKVHLNDESSTQIDNNLCDTDDDDSIENGKTPRKPPRGKNIQRLDDFSWSSSDDESDASYSSSSSSHTKPKPIKSVNKKQNAPKAIDSNLISSSTKISTASSHEKQAARPHGSSTVTGGRSVHTNVKKNTFDISISDDSISLSSSDDDFSIESNEKTSKEKRRFAWSFNKKRKEYTIGGNEKLPAFSVPSDLYDSLYEFQKDGVAWMAGLHVPRIGGILGDDMGMGKTYTTLTFLGGLMRAGTIKKAIVVAPVSVLKNWENEAKKILTQCVRVKIQILSSDIAVNKRKQRLHQALEAQSSQLVITSYGMVAKNPDHFTQHVFGKQVWDYVILDEAHTIKNPTTQNNEAVWKIAQSNKTRRLILTGTPIMNNLKDLHTLFDFATSGKVLGSHKDFLNEFGKPIEAARSADAERFEVERGESAMHELQQLIQPYFLQRMKSEYLAEALPPKHEYVLWTNLSPSQRYLYEEYVQSEHVSSIVGGEAKSPLFAISWLQKLCGHPLLVEKETVELIDSFDDHNIDYLMQASAKLNAMYNLVDALILKGHRTLIFSQSTTVLDIIERVLKDEFKLSRIDGQTKGKDRQTIVDEFNESDSDVEIMLISTKAGGQGLTLTGADSCIVYDPSWNPAEDAQAVDRCYRLGQKKAVQVFRLITAGTVEEKRYEKQIHKDGIRRTILTNTGNDTIKYFTKEELRKKVFILGEEGHCEFLYKLKKRGFAYDETKNPEHTYSNLDGVIGQSSHDIVYSLPENFHLEELIKSPSQQPFSSPPSAAQWISTNNKPVVVSGSKTSLSNKREAMKSPPQPFSSPPSGTKWIATDAKPAVLSGSKGSLSKKKESPSQYPFATPSTTTKWLATKVVTGGPKASQSNEERRFREKENMVKTGNSKLNNSKLGARVEDFLLIVERLYRSGKKELAVEKLMNLLEFVEDKQLNLTESQESKVHQEIARITNELGWLREQK